MLWLKFIFFTLSEDFISGLFPREELELLLMPIFNVLVWDGFWFNGWVEEINLRFIICPTFLFEKSFISWISDLSIFILFLFKYCFIEPESNISLRIVLLNDFKKYI